MLREQHELPPIVYIGNIDYDHASLGKINELVEGYGQICNIKIICESWDYNKKVYAFVRFAFMDDATAATAGLHGRIVAGRTLASYVSEFFDDDDST